MDTLKKSNQWVCYKLDPVHGKVPKNPKTGGNAQPNNPKTWGSLKLAEKVLQNHPDKYDGIGFMFDNGICGIDIDKCIDNPEKEKQAQDIIELMQSYTEYSPSGNGYHILFRCDMSKIPQIDGKPDPKYYQKNIPENIECYFSGLTKRFFTFTGEAISDLDIEDRTEQALIFLDKYMKNEKPPMPTRTQEERNSINIDTLDILSIARNAKNGKNFIELFDQGNIEKYNNDDSSADQALCNILAFYCQGNPEEIDRLFRQSALYREKWEREDYRSATINGAVARCAGKFYTPKIQKNKKVRKVYKPIKVEQHTGAIYINPFETAEAKQRYDWNDIGVGNLFADTYKNLCRYVPEAKAWYFYDGRVWKLDLGKITVLQYAKDLTYYMLDCQKFISDYKEAGEWVKFVGGIMTRKALDNMLALATSVYPVSILEFDKNPYIFNCQNYTLDLNTFTMHKHRPEDFLSKISNVVFDTNAKCERWETFINEIMCGDMEKAKFFQKALGYTLTGDISKECFFILYGSKSRNGKGTSMETTLYMLGDYGKTAQPETIGQKQQSNGGNPSEDIARLRGARFVNMSEPDKGLRLNSALVKQLTGGDTVTARFLHQNSFEYKPQYKLFINTNHLPKVNDDSIFASGRIKLIPFERHFEENERDENLKEFFKEEKNVSGIFNWFIQGLKLLKAEGLKEPKAVIEATEGYREESDTIGLFISECLIEVEAHKTPLKDLYEEYEKWCEGYGYNSLNKGNLTSELRRKGLVIKNSDKNKVYLFGYGITATDSKLPKEWLN